MQRFPQVPSAPRPCRVPAPAAVVTVDEPPLPPLSTKVPLQKRGFLFPFPNWAECTWLNVGSLGGGVFFCVLRVGPLEQNGFGRRLAMTVNLHGRPGCQEAQLDLGDRYWPFVSWEDKTQEEGGWSYLKEGEEKGRRVKLLPSQLATTNGDVSWVRMEAPLPKMGAPSGLTAVIVNWK